jgi:hypothetical protein
MANHVGACSDPYLSYASCWWMDIRGCSSLCNQLSQAFLKPLFLTMIMLKFHLTIRGQSINEEWDAKLTRITPKFAKIKDKVKSYLPEQATETSYSR